MLPSLLLSPGLPPSEGRQKWTSAPSNGNLLACLCSLWNFLLSSREHDRYQENLCYYTNLTLCVHDRWDHLSQSMCMCTPSCAAFVKQSASTSHTERSRTTRTLLYSCTALDYSSFQFYSTVVITFEQKNFSAP